MTPEARVQTLRYITSHGQASLHDQLVGLIRDAERDAEERALTRAADKLARDYSRERLTGLSAARVVRRMIDP